MDYSLSGSTVKTVRVSICKIAFKTIPRCGIATLVLLCIGLYFLFPTCQTFQQIQTEKNTSYELTATTEKSNINLDALMQIEGVERISPVVNLNATLSLEEYKLDCEIRAVYSSFLSLNFIQGTLFPDGSNMTYLILNKAAAKAFTHEHQTTTVSLEDTVLMSANDTVYKATVCGIFDDGNEAPNIYMSYDVAQKGHGTNGQTGLVFQLNNIGSVENVVSALHQQEIHAHFDPNLTLAWNLLQTQCWQTTLLSIGLLACYIVLIREKQAIDIATNHSEITMLLISGMTANSIAEVYPLRLILSEVICALIALFMSLFTGTFSVTAVGLEMICIIVLNVFSASKH